MKFLETMDKINVAWAYNELFLLVATNVCLFIVIIAGEKENANVFAW